MLLDRSGVRQRLDSHRAHQRPGRAGRDPQGRAV